MPARSLILAVLAAAGAALAPDPVEIREWPVPWPDTRPRDPYVAPDGAVWFVGQTGDYIGRLDPKTGEFKRYELDPGTGPHNLVVDAKGQVWYAGNRAAHIGRLDPATGKITKYPMPDPAARDPHTLLFDRQGDLWFTMQGANFVGKLAVQTGEVKLIRVPTPNARPYGIGIDSRGRVWVNLFGTNKLAQVDPATFALREIALPRAEARTRRLVVAPDDRVWYVDYAGGFLGRYDPATGEVKEWPMPGGAQSRPYGMALDDRGRVWAVETGRRPNRLVGFDPGSEQFFSVTEIPSGGGAVRHMYFHRPTREIWFGTDAGTIGRARVP